MRLRLELQLGPIYFLFDPFPEAEDDDSDDEPAIQAVTSVEVGTERRDDYGNPGLHMGFRGGYFEE